MGFAKSQTEAYYLLSEKTRELDSPPEFLALCGAREFQAAPATLAPVWEEREGAQLLLGGAASAPLTCIRRFKLGMRASLIAPSGQISQKGCEPKQKQSICGTGKRSYVQLPCSSFAVRDASFQGERQRGNGRAGKRLSAIQLGKQAGYCSVWISNERLLVNNAASSTLGFCRLSY